MNRRRFVACFSSLGLGASLMPGALAAVAHDATTITLEMVEAAQTIAGLTFTAAAPKPDVPPRVVRGDALGPRCQNPAC
jgi:hypothetical protein